MSKSMIQVPNPQFFRHRKDTARKLSKEEKKSQEFYHKVPRFFDLYHPTTNWLVNVIRSENEKELTRVLQDKSSKSLLKFVPDPRAIQVKRTVIEGKKDFVITKAKYFQVIDRPSFYCSSDSRASLFNRHTVMYLTPLGLAIYLHKPKAARILVECVDRDTNLKHVLARQPQFITFMNERFGDLMCMYDHNLAMLTEAYSVLQLMLQNDNWFPMEPFKLVYRKRFVETYLNFDDYMDFAFYIMFTKRSSIDIPSLVAALLKVPTEHFRYNYLCQPTRANKMTLLRDADRVINNCKTYPRRLLRCAFYADKKLKSTMNLVRAAGLFINSGIFKLVGDPAIPFVPKAGRRRRLEAVPPYRERGRGLRVDWPSFLYEFDADCCIALLVGLLSKCYRLGKTPTFQQTIHLAVKVLADSGWLNYFNLISDLEFTDYFMGLDDAEKVRFQPEVFGFVRDCARIVVIDQRHELARFFSEERLDQEIRALNDVRDPAVLTRMLMCSDKSISHYVTLEKGESLKEASQIIGGSRVRGEGRNDPANRYYMDRLAFPKESIKTVMTNTANTEDSSDSAGSATSSSSSSNACPANDEDVEVDNPQAEGRLHRDGSDEAAARTAATAAAAAAATAADVGSFPNPGSNRSNDEGCCADRRGSAGQQQLQRKKRQHQQQGRGRGLQFLEPAGGGMCEFMVDTQVVRQPNIVPRILRSSRSRLSSGCSSNGSFLPVPVNGGGSSDRLQMPSSAAAAAAAASVASSAASVNPSRSLLIRSGRLMLHRQLPPR